MGPGPPPVFELVLIGGGHSHVQVLRSLGMRPLRGVRITLISREVYTPYSGMLPGYVAGVYGWRDIHIDLGPLARFAGARLLADEVTALDPDARRITLARGPALRYDLVSINSGAVPARPTSAGVAVKPIGQFIPHWQRVRRELVPGESVAVAGAGAGGAELSLAMRRALGQEVAITLYGPELLPGGNHRARGLLRRALARQHIRLEPAEVVDVEAGAKRQMLVTAAGERRPADHLFWVTGVRGPDWLARSGLTTDAGGFVIVDDTLRSVSHPTVFAAGDAAALQHQARPKSGVFAVRQGPLLTANLRRSAEGRRLRRYRAQHASLAIIGTADGRAIALRGGWAAQGRWAWWWKRWVDGRFMARFSRLPVMSASDQPLPATLASRLPEPMRCGGCGAKIAADPLRRVLARLPAQDSLGAGVLVGVGDDAAILRPTETPLLLSVDGFRSFLDDAYLFGRITAHHSLNDVYAMGGSGLAALAMATVPLMTQEMMEDELYRLLLGAVEVLNADGVPLVGGHSAEGGELALSLTVTGTQGAAPLRKSGMRPGDVLVLTKALGTGVILAAHMRGAAGSDLLAAAIASMDHSNAAALAVLRDYGVGALTDVSGFGLLGHLGEMLRASRLGAVVRTADVATLPGALGCLTAGHASSLQAGNALALTDFELQGLGPADAAARILVDPQTSGGLLGAVPAASAAECVAALRRAGYPQAAVIGTVTDGPWRVEAV